MLSIYNVLLKLDVNNMCGTFESYVWYLQNLCVVPSKVHLSFQVSLPEGQALANWGLCAEGFFFLKRAKPILKVFY